MPPPAAENELPSPTPPGSPEPLLRRRRLLPWLGAHLREPIDTRYTDLSLLLCCLISGLTDSAAFAAWGTFLSMQTGNTVFLALGASGQPTNAPDSWLKSLTSIVCFVLGCFIFPRVMRRAGHDGLTRGALAGSFFVQTLFMVTAAALVRGEVIPVPVGLVTPAQIDPTDPRLIELVGIGLLAFQAGGQIVASRVLGFNEIPTVVLTSVYCDLSGDPNLFRANNKKRDRRVLAVCLILLGGIAGGWITRSPGGMDVVIWLAAGLKFGMSLTCLFWRRRPDAS